MFYIGFLVGLFLLIAGGDILVSGSIIIARRLHVSPLLIGLLLIGFGTSLPELSTSVLAVFRGAPGLAVGNVIGSNVANILLVLGVAAILKPIQLNQDAFKRDALFLGLSTVILLISLLKGHISWELGALMCMTLAFYIYHTYKTDKVHVKKLNLPVSHVAIEKRFYISTTLAIILTISGLILVLTGAHFLVNCTIIIAGHLGISEAVIGLTVVALGTSLPELITSIMASIKQESDVALGNVIGSNIYNALLILGATALVMPITAPASVQTDVIVMTAATALLLFVGFFNGCIGRKMGIFFLLSYCAYIFYLGIQ